MSVPLLFEIITGVENDRRVPDRPGSQHHEQRDQRDGRPASTPTGLTATPPSEPASPAPRPARARGARAASRSAHPQHQRHAEYERPAPSRRCGSARPVRRARPNTENEDVRRRAGGAQYVREHGSRRPAGCTASRTISVPTDPNSKGWDRRKRRRHDSGRGDRTPTARGSRPRPRLPIPITQLSSWWGVHRVGAEPRGDRTA